MPSNRGTSISTSAGGSIGGGSKGARGGKKGKRNKDSFQVDQVDPIAMEMELEYPQSQPILAPLAQPLPEQLYETHILNEWELNCIGILKRLKKHDFLDTTRRDKCMSNYYARMTSTDPNINK